MDNGTTIVEPVEDGFRVRRIGLGNLKFTKVMESDQGVYRCLAVSTKNRRNNSGQTILNVNCKFTSKALIVFRHIMNNLGLSRLGFEHLTFSMQGDRCLASS